MVKCKFCNKRIKRKGFSTSNLLRHVRRVHKDRLALMEDKSGPAKQPDMRDHFKKIESTSKYHPRSMKKKLRDKALSRFIAQDMRAIYLTECPGFIHFCHVMDPSYTVASRRTVKEGIRKLDKATKDVIKTQLQKVEAAAITADLWTSKAVTHYMAVTAHFVDSAGELQTKTLSCDAFKERELSDNIRKRVKEVLEEFKITDKVIASCTDRGSNVKKALRDAGIRWIACFAHCLNTCVKDAFKDMTSGEIELEFGFGATKKRISELVTLLKISTVAKIEFDQCQRKLKPNDKKFQPLALKQTVETRWNADYLMFERFLKVQDGVLLYQRTESAREHNISFSQDNLDITQEALEILEPIYDVTVEISGEHYVTGSKIIPLAKILLGGYSAMSRENQGQNRGTSTVKTQAQLHFRRVFAEALHKNLYHHLAQVEEMDLLRLATICDPRYKKIGFRFPEQASNAVKSLKDEMTRLENVRVSASAAQPESRPQTAKKTAQRKRSFWNAFDQEVERTTTNSAPVDDIGTEVFKYLKMKNIPREDNPLTWWQEVGKELFPRIYRVAVKYLIIPGSSVPSERVFSSAGTTISAKRCRLAEDIAASQVCIHQNLKESKKAKRHQK